MKPQLTIRDLFWLVLVMAIFTAWGLDHQRSAATIENLTRETFAPAGGSEIVDINTDDGAQSIRLPGP